MKTFKSILAAAAAATLAVCAAQSASAALVEFNLGPLASPSFTHFGVGLNTPIGFPSTDTFAWDFQTSDRERGIFDMVLSNNGSETMAFDLQKCTGISTGCATIASSAAGTGPTIPSLGGTFPLAAGDYRVITTLIVHPVGEPGNLGGTINLLSSVPEPSTWAMMILGVGLIGFAARRRREGMAVAA